MFLSPLKIRVIVYSSFMSVTVRSSRSATWVWTRPRDMYRSWVMDTLACPRWSAPIRAESPASSISVATVLRKLCDVTSGIPSSSRTARHAVLKFSGSLRVPLLEAKIVCCWPTYGRLRRSLRTVTAKGGNGMVRRHYFGVQSP